MIWEIEQSLGVFENKMLGIGCNIYPSLVKACVSNCFKNKPLGSEVRTLNWKLKLNHTCTNYNILMYGLTPGLKFWIFLSVIPGIRGLRNGFISEIRLSDVPVIDWIVDNQRSFLKVASDHLAQWPIRQQRGGKMVVVVETRPRCVCQDLLMLSKLFGRRISSK